MPASKTILTMLFSLTMNVKMSVDVRINDLTLLFEWQQPILIVFSFLVIVED